MLEGRVGTIAKEMTEKMNNRFVRVNAARPSMFKLCMGDPCVGMTDCTGQACEMGQWAVGTEP